MTGIMGFLDYKAAGEVWNEDEIKNYIDEVHAAGLRNAKSLSPSTSMRTSSSVCPRAMSTSQTTAPLYETSPSTASRSSSITSCRCSTGCAPTLPASSRGRLEQPVLRRGGARRYGAARNSQEHHRKQQRLLAPPAGSLSVWQSLNGYWHCTRISALTNCARITNTSSTASSRPVRSAAL